MFRLGMFESGENNCFLNYGHWQRRLYGGGVCRCYLFVRMSVMGRVASLCPSARLTAEPRLQQRATFESTEVIRKSSPPLRLLFLLPWSRPARYLAFPGGRRH